MKTILNPMGKVQNTIACTPDGHRKDSIYGKKQGKSTVK